MRIRIPFALLAGAAAAAMAFTAMASCGGDSGEPKGGSSSGNNSSSGSDVDASNTTPDGSSSGEIDSGGGTDGGVDSGPGTGLSPTFVHRDINHVLATGQSLSVGAVGNPPLSTTQPYDNIMFSTGVIAGSTNLIKFSPLVEATVETMSSGFANLITKMAREDLLTMQPAGKTSHDLLVSVHGVGGFSYAQLKKGTNPYAAGMAQTKAAFDLAKADNKSFVVRAVTNVHGETDHNQNNLGYAQNLAEWQANYETDVKAITGQTDSIPMFHSQISSWTKLNGAATSPIVGQQLATHLSSNGKIVLVGPKYFLTYVVDGVHLTNKGYEQMGEYYAKVYRRVVLEGKPWDPVRPLTVTRNGAVITIKFAVPKPPLTIDTTLVTDPGKNGFEYTDTGIVPSPTITTVAVTAPDTVTITLSAAPSGTDKRIRYAFTGTSGALGGPKTGPRGNLRDSDPTASRDGFNLYNWCVHFDEAVP